MSKYQLNSFNTTDLVLNVMSRCADVIEQDINDDSVADKLYWICCDLESFPEDEGFGSSDHYSYVNAAREEFGLTTHQAYKDAMQTVARYLAENISKDNIWNDTERTYKEIDRLIAYSQSFRK